MPLNSVPATTTVAALEAKHHAARGLTHVDTAMWGGIVPGNEGDVEPLVDAGVRGFKCFLVPSGAGEFAHVGESTLRRVMPVLARRGVPLLVHAELPEYLRPHRGRPGSYREYAATRPVDAERSAIRPHGDARAGDRRPRPHRTRVLGGGGPKGRGGAR